jgi:hypothetical protein
MADRNGYIGRAPSDSSVIVARQTFSPTGVTTDFTFSSGYTVGYFDIFINGVKMIEGSDYTSTDGLTFSVLNGGVTSGDVIEGVAYKAFNLVDRKVGILSAGSLIGNANNLNFVGTGNTFLLNGTTVDIAISGGGAGAGGTWSTNASGIHTTKSVGIGTTTATGAADTNNTAVLNVGIVTANSLFGTLTGDVTGDVTGTATGLSGSPNITINNLTGVAATFTGVLTYEDVTNVDSVGIVTARSGLRVVGGGATVTGVSTFFSDVSIADKIIHTGDTDTSIRFPAANVFTIETAGTERFRVLADGTVSSGTLASTPGTIAAGSLVVTNSNAGFFSNVGGDAKFGSSDNNNVIFQVNGSEKVRIATSGQIGLGGANYGTSGQVILSNGSGSAPTWGDIPAAGVTTEAFTSSGIVTAVRLGTAVDHKITATGITTITSSGSGTEGESHTIRIVNSGIATVGFSTYFLFPSGAAPTLPTADGAISLISFTVHDSVGAGCTQLLAGASVNYS